MTNVAPGKILADPIKCARPEYVLQPFLPEERLFGRYKHKIKKSLHETALEKIQNKRVTAQLEPYKVYHAHLLKELPEHAGRPHVFVSNTSPDETRASELFMPGRVEYDFASSRMSITEQIAASHERTKCSTTMPDRKFSRHLEFYDRLAKKFGLNDAKANLSFDAFSPLLTYTFVAPFLFPFYITDEGTAKTLTEKSVLAAQQETGTDLSHWLSAAEAGQLKQGIYQFSHRIFHFKNASNYREDARLVYDSNLLNVETLAMALHKYATLLGIERMVYYGPRTGYAFKVLKKITELHKISPEFKQKQLHDLGKIHRKQGVVLKGICDNAALNILQGHIYREFISWRMQNIKMPRELQNRTLEELLKC